MGMIIHLPKQFMQAQPAPKMPADDRGDVEAVMNVLSLHLCGSLAACVPTEDHAAFLEAASLVLDRLEANRVERQTQGWAS